ncbi:MAG: hypothetical protein ACW981_01525 [Candidatus Hodarchaeales archaeon]|jgi:hypothetical protein
MVDVFLKSILDIQPSQLYLNAAKIAKIKELYYPISLGNMTPIPIKQLHNDIIFVDGHTRAYMAFRKGITQIPVYWEIDTDLDWEFYEIYVNWCKFEGIKNISHLKNRIVKNSEYKVLWIKKCRKLHNNIGEKEN